MPCFYTYIYISYLSCIQLDFSKDFKPSCEATSRSSTSNCMRILAVKASGCSGADAFFTPCTVSAREEYGKTMGKYLGTIWEQYGKKIWEKNMGKLPGLFLNPIVSFLCIFVNEDAFENQFWDRTQCWLPFFKGHDVVDRRPSDSKISASWIKRSVTPWKLDDNWKRY